MKRLRLATAVLALSALASLSARAEDTVLRVGHFPNVTHAHGVIGHALSRQGKGFFEERLGPGVKIEWYVYNAGPSAMEAVFAKSIDLTYVGPNPAINAHMRSKGSEIRIVAGACSGGAALVVHGDGRIGREADFKGKKVASPQLGNTQDVAARAWLKSKGYKVGLAGGDVSVLPTANPDQLALLAKGDVDAVWTVEPWVTRLLLEANGKIYLEEKALWPETGGRYVTTHLVSRAAFLAERKDLVEKFVQAHVELTQWIAEHPEEAKRLVNDEIKEETGRGIAKETLDGAWSRIEITNDPVRASLVKSAEDAHAVGFIKEKPDLSKIYDLSILNAILGKKGLSPVQ